MGELGITSMHNLPIRFTGQERLHSSAHLRGLQRSADTIAMRVNFSSPLVEEEVVVAAAVELVLLAPAPPPGPRFPGGIPEARLLPQTQCVEPGSMLLRET